MRSRRSRWPGWPAQARYDWERYADKRPEDFATWIKTVRDDIAACPVPELELPSWT